MIDGMILNVLMVIVGILLIFSISWIDNNTHFIISGTLGVVLIFLGSFFIYHDTKSYYEKYIPTLQEQVIQGKISEQEKKLEEMRNEL